MKSADRLTRLIDNILDLERMAAGTLVLSCHEWDLSDLVDAAVAQITPFASDAGVRLLVQPAPASAQVWADRDRIIQAITNLLGNAVKFSPADAESRPRPCWTVTRC